MEIEDIVACAWDAYLKAVDVRGGLEAQIELLKKLKFDASDYEELLKEAKETEANAGRLFLEVTIAMLEE